jgi:hypothetical protein
MRAWQTEPPKSFLCDAGRINQACGGRGFALHATGVTLLLADYGCVLKHKLAVHNIEEIRTCCAENDTLLTQHFDPQRAHQ